jgi:transposase
MYDMFKGKEKKMSTSPYSEDLRNKVIKYLELGKSQRSASETFDLNPSTISRWWLRYKREGNCMPRSRLGREPKVNLLQIKAYIECNPNFRSCDMGKHFGMTGGGALYWLKKLGFSYKKKTSPIWRRAKRSEINTKKL